MTSFNCYALNNVLEGQNVTGFDDFVDFDDRDVTSHGPVVHPGFQAKLYISTLAPRDPSWAPFLRGGFPALAVPDVESVGALLILRLESNQYFAFTFGGLGRHMMKEGAWRRNYGLRTALNLIYPNQASLAADENRVLAMDSRRRAARRTRSRTQATSAATLEELEFDQLRDLLRGVTGRPIDTQTWGFRITGTDALYLDIPRDFDTLGDLCKSIDGAYQLVDYQQRFPWLDRVRIVSDPDQLRQLEEAVVIELESTKLESWDLAPPDITDWTRLRAFRLPFEGAQGVTHPELRIQDVVAKLQGKGGGIDIPKLRRSQITGLDGDGAVIDRWSIWRCLSGEFELHGHTYVFDGGDFFIVDKDYLTDLNAFISNVPAGSVVLPSSTNGEIEKHYNTRAAASLGGEAILLDTRTVRSTASTTPVEVCDILTAGRSLIHVKRHLGSSQLSHLFAQGAVAAELLQNSHEFRVAAQAEIDEVTSDARFQFFGTDPIATSSFEVGYVIVAEWRSRTLAQAMPFFSKVNFRGTVQRLVSRGYRVTCSAVDVNV